jgi:predicted membrane protein
MAYFKRTTIFKQVLFSRWTALVILFAIVFVGYGLFSVIGKSMDARASRVRAENEAVAIQNKEADLSKKIASLNTEDGKEAVLREQFSVVKEGEHVVVITDEVKTASTSQSSAGSSKGFWNFLKGLFRK